MHAYAKPGAPLDTAPARPSVLVTSQGDLEEGDGCRVEIRDGYLMFEASLDGSHIQLGVELCRILEHIQSYNHSESN